MANRILQLLRSSQLYSSLAAAKTAVQGTNASAKDGEIRIARYNAGTEQAPEIKSLLCVFHNASGITPAGWTFVQDSDAANAALQTEVDAIETAVGLSESGAYQAPSGTNYLGETTSVMGALGALDTAVDGIQDAINAMDENENYGDNDTVTSDGKVITAVKQVDGAVSALSSDFSDLKLAGYSKTNDSGAIAATDTVEQAFSKLENGIAAVSGIDLLAEGDAIDIAEGTDTNAGKTVISAKYDNDTITLNNDGELQTALTLNYNAAVTTDGSEAPATITLQTTGANPTVLGTVNVSSIIGNGILQSTSYSTTTGILTLTFANADGSTTPVQVDLTDMFDVDDIAVKNDSTDFLTFAPVSPEAETGQALIGVKLADVTYTATSGNTPASLTVDTTNGKLLDASDAIPAINSYVADVLANANANLAVTAEGDAYVSATVDANVDNKHVIVESNVVTMANASSSNTGLADAYDVKNYVDTKVGAEETRATGAEQALNTVLTGSADGTYSTNIGGASVVADMNTIDSRLDAVEATAGTALQSVSPGNNAIGVGTKDANENQTISLVLDQTTANTDQGLTGSNNALQITSAGLFLSNVWDCGTY